MEKQIQETSTTNIAKLREELREVYGKRKYRITQAGEVHIYGIMPNTNITGWWFYGYV